VVNSSTLFKTLYQARGFWFSPNPQAAFQRLVERIFGDPLDADLRDAILRSRVESYYAPRLWKETDLQILKLLQLVRHASAQGSRALVVMAPQNVHFFETQESIPQLQENVERLSALLSGVSGVRFRSFLETYPPEYFLDHCHLSPQGNQKFAEAIAKEMEDML
jgi:hypothetical protein